MKHEFFRASRYQRSSALICGYIFLLAIILSFTSSAQASSNIISRSVGVSRPVGVMVFNLPEQSQSLLSLPYKPLNPSLESVIGDQLTGSTNAASADAILLWDNTNMRYRSLSRVNGKWQEGSSTGEISDVAMEAGTAFWVVNRQWTNEVMMLGGSVLMDATNAVILSPALNLIGLSYNSALAFQNSGLPQNGKDRLIDGAGNSVSNMIPGQGYWYHLKGNNPRIWVETRPYNNIFPGEGESPSITAIQIGSGKEVILSIDCQGLDNGAKLDIYYQDLMTPDRMDGEKDHVTPKRWVDGGEGGWLIAETDISVNGQSSIEWTDAGNFTRKPVSETSGRYYLVGRSDISGSDGVPLCRSRFVFNKGLQGPEQQFSETVASALRADPSTASRVSTNLASTTNRVPFVSKSSPVIGKIIYVDRKRGGDHFSGKSAVVVGGDGPKQTVRSGLSTAQAGDTMVIKSGVYDEDMNIFGRGVQVRIEGNVRIGRSKETISAKEQAYQPAGTNFVNKNK